MYNEVVFIAQSSLVGLATLISLKLGEAALTATIVLFAVFANFFVVKQAMLFGFQATCADAFTIGVVLGLNLLQEYYGRQVAQRAIITCSYALLVYLGMSVIHLWYTPSISDTTHVFFAKLLSTTPRVACSSLLVSYLIQQCDSSLYAILTRKWPAYVLTKTLVSISICQFFDTVIFTYLALYGLVEHPWDVIWLSYGIKLVALAIAGPWVRLARSLV